MKKYALTLLPLGLTSAMAQQKPNILVIIADDMGRCELGCYGGQNLATPNIDRVANEGMLMTNNFASMAMSVPIRASMYTGLYPAHHGSFLNHKATYSRVKSVTHYLSDLGYRVGRAGKDHPVNQPKVYGFEEIPGFVVGCTVSHPKKSTPEGILEFMQRDSSQPFCLFVCSINSHMPWDAGDPSEFNPSDQYVALDKREGSGGSEVVNVTSTEGGKQEVRERNIFEATLDIPEGGDYSLLLDVGQKMARRHNLMIDGKTVIEMKNLWLPPTASAIVSLAAGKHTVTAELSKGDTPILYYNKVKDETVFRSPVATAVDYTVFVGTPDEVIASLRELTGPSPLMPQWALGYIHCRERFHSSDEILTTAQHFRREHLPVDVLVQDWQYWGKYGWNASVWSKIDKSSEVGKQMLADWHYIPGTDWIDFFSPDAAAAYWKNFSQRLVPLGIDAWWQDATEPENDDLAGRRVNNGKWSGEEVRNVYPLLVNKTVYEGLRKDAPNRRPMILTRCGFPGIQRYGSAMWSGDVGNDWETFRRQIVAGLGMQAAGMPWWTYDAGGFFRPGNQYSDQAYIRRMLRWIETSVYLPLMRVHGYMSNTEPWNYGPEAQAVIAACLQQRQQLQPYLQWCARQVSEKGYTLMRPLVFDFADDPEALHQECEYMFGPSLLISPVTAPGVTEWRTYLPKSEGGWTDYRTGKHYDGGQTVTIPVDKTFIPVFVRNSAATLSGVSLLKSR